jgi:hypothetical protein
MRHKTGSAENFCLVSDRSPPLHASASLVHLPKRALPEFLRRLQLEIGLAEIGDVICSVKSSARMTLADLGESRRAGAPATALLRSPVGGDRRAAV